MAGGDMSDRIGLGLSSIPVSEYRPTPWERLKEIAALAVVCVLLAIFFFYLTKQVQIGTEHATGSGGQSETTSP
jgi:hypothetical protein